MSYFTAGHRYQDEVSLTLSASSLKDSSSNGSSIDPEGACVGYFTLDVTASDTPTTLDVVIEELMTDDSTWYTAGSFTQVGAVGSANQTIAVPLAGRKVRAKWTIVGASYTFSVSGVAKRH